jgi:hypothetical protein
MRFFIAAMLVTALIVGQAQAWPWNKTKTVIQTPTVVAPVDPVVTVTEEPSCCDGTCGVTTTTVKTVTTTKRVGPVRRILRLRPLKWLHQRRPVRRAIGSLFGRRHGCCQ